MENYFLKKHMENKTKYFYPDLNHKIKEFFHYKRLGLIDSGTYGKVFKVKNLKNKKLYACKEIKVSVKKRRIKFYCSS